MLQLVWDKFASLLLLGQGVSLYNRSMTLKERKELLEINLINIHSFHFIKTIFIRTLRPRLAPKFKKMQGLKLEHPQALLFWSSEWYTLNKRSSKWRPLQTSSLISSLINQLDWKPDGIAIQTDPRRTWGILENQYNCHRANSGISQAPLLHQPCFPVTEVKSISNSWN